MITLKEPADMNAQDIAELERLARQYAESRVMPAIEQQMAKLLVYLLDGIRNDHVPLFDEIMEAVRCK